MNKFATCFENANIDPNVTMSPCGTDTVNDFQNFTFQKLTERHRFSVKMINCNRRLMSLQLGEHCS